MFEKIDFANDSLAPSLHPQSASADVSGAAVDLRGYDGALVVCHAGAGSSLTGSNHYRFLVQHTSTAQADGTVDASTFENVGSGDLTGKTDAVVATVDAAAEDDTIYTASYVGAKRWIRVLADEVGNGSTLLVAAHVLRNRQKYVE